MINRLEGSKAMVIGCNSEVAAAITEALARQNVSHIVGTYLAGAEESWAGLNEVTRITSGLTKFDSMPLDQTNTADIRRIMDAAMKTMGGLDIVVAAAARQWDGKGGILAMSDAEFDAQVDVNLRGSLHVIVEAARRMIALSLGGDPRHRGIAAIVSVRGAEPYAAQPYDAAKSGIIHFVRAFAAELGPHGIKIGAIAPGTVDVALEPIRHDCTADEYRARWKDLTPFGGRPVTPQMVGEATVDYLNSTASTGDLVYVDGGFHNMRPLPKRAGQ